MKKAILATKIGMTQIFGENGVLTPVTVLQAGPCAVTQVKTVETDGYNAVQVGFGEIRDVLVNKPEYVYDRHAVRKKRSDNEIGIHAIRGGTIVGEHDVIFAGNNEVVTLSHLATSKEIFAEGAVKAAKYLAGKKPGLYNMDSLIKEL